MPRKSRIDAPGALQHVVARGVNRQAIFIDDTDRYQFMERLGMLLEACGTACYAWALIPNHFHLLLRSGTIPLSALMRRLLTGYAVTFNLRHERVGHVFQNRYKSILCQEDNYLLELVRYIHLNPLRAGLVGSCTELADFPFCGHAVIMGARKAEWQDTDYVLRRFAASRRAARRMYEGFVEKGADTGNRFDLTGGGLVRSAGGWSAVKALRRAQAYQKGDERILGDGDFLNKVLSASKERLERSCRLAAAGRDLDWLIARVSDLTGVAADRVASPDKSHRVSRARSLLCFWATRELGISQTALAERLQLKQPAVSHAARRGRQLAFEEGYSIEPE